MAETFFEEMKRYVRFGAADEAALRALKPAAERHYARIADEFYARILEHPEARSVLSGPDQVTRLKCTLVDWMDGIFSGPWDESYYQKRARIGRAHVQIALPQRYMLGAMNLIRIALQDVVREVHGADDERRTAAICAIAKIIDLELAIMLETYREAFVDKVQQLDRLERSLLERRLAISEARYEEIVEKGEALITTADPDGTILLFNRRCEELTGLDRKDALAKNWLDIFVTENERDLLLRRRPDVLAGRRVPAYEGTLRHVDGTERRVRWHFTTLPGGAGPVLCAIGIDVTEEHELALRTRRAERLASLGTMAAGLAHEIRNPLNAAHLQLTLLQRRLGRNEVDLAGAHDAAEIAAAEMKRLAALVEEFLQFARPQPLRLSRADLRATAQSVVSLLRPEAEAQAIRIDLIDGVAVNAEIDEERMKQVILNLVRNAIEAVGRGGSVQVRVGARDGNALLEVEDDGPGIPSPDAPIFEPFYTSKPKGTGLGLSIVHRIVSDHGGTIGVDSRPGRTVFSVLVPLG